MKYDFAIEILQTELFAIKATVRKLDRFSAEVQSNIPVARELEQIRELSDAIVDLRRLAAMENTYKALGMFGHGGPA